MIFGVPASRFIIGFLLVSICILVVVIAYRKLIGRFSRGHVKHKDFGVLHGLENITVSGVVEFYFTTEAPKDFVFSILDKELNEMLVLHEQNYPSGGHIIRFDTQVLANGIYFYCLRSDVQKTFKKMVVQHDKAAAEFSNS